jgi:chromosome segregation ATPase
MREQLQALTTERDQLATAARDAQSQVEHQNEQLNAAKTKLREFSALIEEQADAADQVVALTQDLETSEQTIESLREELSLAGSDREGQIRALAEKLEAAERDLAAARSELEQSQERVGELIRAVEEREATIEEMQQAGPSANDGELQRALEESRAQVQALRTRLEAAEQALASRKGDSGLNEQLLERQLDERDAEIEELRRQCRQYAARAEELAAGSDGELTALRNRVRELETEANRPARLDIENAPAELAAQAARVNDAVEWAETRRRRLRMQQSLLSERSEKLLQVQNVLSERHAQYERLLGQQKILDQARWQLQTAEKKLIKRWARSKGAVLGMAFGILVGVLAVASFFTAQQVAPATYRAGATLQPETRAGGTVPPDARDAWGEAIQEMTTSRQVLKAAADRMGQRGYVEFDEPEELGPYPEGQPLGRARCTRRPAGRVALPQSISGGSTARYVRRRPDPGRQWHARPSAGRSGHEAAEFAGRGCDSSHRRAAPVRRYDLRRPACRERTGLHVRDAELRTVQAPLRPGERHARRTR